MCWAHEKFSIKFQHTVSGLIVHKYSIRCMWKLLLLICWNFGVQWNHQCDEQLLFFLFGFQELFKWDCALHYILGICFKFRILLTARGFIFVVCSSFYCCYFLIFNCCFALRNDKKKRAVVKPFILSVKCLIFNSNFFSISLPTE